jgi:FdhD protein
LPANSESKAVQLQSFSEGSLDSNLRTDCVAPEVPLEIRVEGQAAAITMRSPGHDLDLVAGFLWTEGVIDGPDDLRAIAHVDDPARPEGNTVDVVLAEGVPAARGRLADRSFFSSSSCGVCGKATLDRLLVDAPPISSPVEPAPELLLALGAQLESEQTGFARTGGLHGAALFDLDGQLLVAREDIGRHNAVDKVLGHMLRSDQSCDQTLLLVSSRAGFEIVQKALVARVPVVCAIGAPSSMAVDLADRAAIYLVGFLREGRYNLYRGLA